MSFRLFSSCLLVLLTNQKVQKIEKMLSLVLDMLSLRWNTQKIICYFLVPYTYIWGFPGSSAGKEFTCNAGDLDLIPGLGRSAGGGHSNPFQYSCLENPHGQSSLVGYSSLHHKESDTTEQLSIAQHVYRYL